MATVMTDDERRAFLLEGTRTGKVAWISPQGNVHVAPVWFVLDGTTSSSPPTRTARRARR
ncbi:MAG TPA: hypothetical protein VFP02_11895 [Acidimicrobiales bacterium]|nr:hypothetical protein [Acidimicrobiales bacterium]